MEEAPWIKYFKQFFWGQIFRISQILQHWLCHVYECFPLNFYQLVGFKLNTIWLVFKKAGACAYSFPRVCGKIGRIVLAICVRSKNFRHNKTVKVNIVETTGVCVCVFLYSGPFIIRIKKHKYLVRWLNLERKMCEKQVSQ